MQSCLRPASKCKSRLRRLTLQEECIATCAESYEAKSSATALTSQMCHFDGHTYADSGLQFSCCVTTTLSQCSDSPIAQTEKFEALDCTNLTVGKTCAIGCGLASGGSLSENESVACPTGSLHACQMTRRSTSTNPVPFGVSEDCENITYGDSCPEACQRTSFPHTRCRVAQSHFPTDRWRGRRAQCGWQTQSPQHKPTSDSSMSVPDWTDLTSGDQVNGMCAAGYTGSASTLTWNLDVVNGSVSLIGSLPNCSAALCAVDGTPSGMSHDSVSQSIGQSVNGGRRTHHAGPHEDPRDAEPDAAPWLSRPAQQSLSN